MRAFMKTQPTMAAIVLRCSFAAVFTAAFAAGSPCRAAEAGAAGTVQYAIEAGRSSVSFEMAATLHTVIGRTTSVSGALTTPVSAGVEGFPVSGSISIKAATLDTDNSARDRKMKSRILSVEKYPEITFVPTRATGAGLSLAAGARVNFTLEGTLTILETTRPVSIAVSAVIGQDRLTADGTTAILFPDYGVPDPSNFFLRVQPNLKISIHLEARRFPPA
jgi:polyisoprenoid-binding protein YceI